MPAIQSRHVGLAMDMHGCPNRCRHCYLGCPPNGHMSESDLRWAAGQFRTCTLPGEDQPFVERLSVMSWTREPDYSDDYRRLAALEAELGRGKPTRFELLSVWRLARDESYAAWAKAIGPHTCQISFFGLERTQDWFCRRRGAFGDCLRATERLLEVGMNPRWQLFMTKKILPDLAGLMRVVDRMRLRQRVEELGGQFVMFIHPPGLHGEGLGLTDLCASMEDTAAVPSELAESTRRHFGTEKIWTTEGEVVARVLAERESGGGPYPYPSPMLWFEVHADWDVYSNMGAGSPWWRLGNLKADGAAAVLEAFRDDRILPLRINRPGMLVELARRYGRAGSSVLVNGIEETWAERCCQETFGQARP